MTGTLLRASWSVVGRPPALVLIGAATLMVAATAPFLDAGNAHQVRTGVAALLACALAATAEDPAGEVAAASPHPPWVRCGARLLLGLALALPIAMASLAVVEQQATTMPTYGAGLQMLGILLAGPAIGFAVWAWGDTAQPTYVAMAGVLCLSLALLLLPAGWSILEVQPWGPPWEAALIRWSALVCLSIAVVATAWRDPSARR